MIRFWRAACLLEAIPPAQPLKRLHYLTELRRYLGHQPEVREGWSQQAARLEEKYPHLRGALPIFYHAFSCGETKLIESRLKTLDDLCVAMASIGESTFWLDLMALELLKGSTRGLQPGIAEVLEERAKVLLREANGSSLQATEFESEVRRMMDWTLWDFVSLDK